MIYTKEGKKNEGETKTAMHVCAAEVSLEKGFRWTFLVLEGRCGCRLPLSQQDGEFRGNIVDLGSTRNGTHDNVVAEFQRGEIVSPVYFLRVLSHFFFFFAWGETGSCFQDAL